VVRFFPLFSSCVSRAPLAVYMKLLFLLCCLAGTDISFLSEDMILRGNLLFWSLPPSSGVLLPGPSISRQSVRDTQGSSRISLSFLVHTRSCSVIDESLSSPKCCFVFTCYRTCSYCFGFSPPFPFGARLVSFCALLPRCHYKVPSCSRSHLFNSPPCPS